MPSKTRNTNKPTTTLIALLAANTMAQTPPETTLETNTQRAGVAYSTLITNTATDCATDCLSQPQCAAFEFEKSTSLCRLKSTATTPTDDGCCISGARGATPRLIVVTANMFGTSNLDSAHNIACTPNQGDCEGWWVRHRRLAAAINGAGAPPDIISLTEMNGKDSWQGDIQATGYASVKDYQPLEWILRDLEQLTGIQYRIAYHVGHREYYSLQVYWGGDAVLYNPARLINLTPTEISNGGVEHDAFVFGPQVRKSLPACDGTIATLSRVVAALDGPSINQSGCAVPTTPTGPAWVLMQNIDYTKNGAPHNLQQVMASMARFAFAHDPRPSRSFDVFTLHPNIDTPTQTYSALLDFIYSHQRPPYRSVPPAIPAIVLGDLNQYTADIATRKAIGIAPWLHDNTWNIVDGIPFGRQEAQEYLTSLPFPSEMMAIYKGSRYVNGGFEAHSDLLLLEKRDVPNGCLMGPPFGFSDHCALRVEFYGDAIIANQ